MSSIKVEVTGDKRRLLRQLNQLEGVDVKGVNRALAEGLRTSTQERFREEKGPQGKKWKTSIRVREEGGKTLTVSSRLKNSIRSTASAAGLAVGTNDIRAATLQFGDTRTIRPRRGPLLRFKINGQWVSTKKVRIHIPGRPFLGISEEDNREIIRTLEKVLEES